MVDGVSYQISENFTAEDIPADFEEAAVGYHGSEHKGVNYSRGAVSMLYLKPEGDESAAGKFYIYDEAGDAFYAFVKFGAGEKYVFALPLVANEELQAVCAQNPVQIEGAGSIAAYQENEEFYIFYAMNQDGYGGWYRYDSVEGTHQRFTRLTGVQDVEEEAAAEETVEMEYLRQEYSALSSRYSDEKKSARNLIAILIFCNIHIPTSFLSEFLSQLPPGNLPSSISRQVSPETTPLMPTHSYVSDSQGDSSSDSCTA